jgi:Asp/Glu/hydantoin racemase
VRLLLINPNTNVDTTARMVALARDGAPDDVSVAGLTVAFGAPLITEPAALAVAADAVVDAARNQDLSDVAGIIVAAFGDPGLDLLRSSVACPVTGIAEAGLAEAAQGGRRFAVATTTPGLVGSIADLVCRYGHADRFVGTFLTSGDIDAVMRDPAYLADALLEAAGRAVAAGAEAVVIGGGPLAAAARIIAPLVGVPVVEPIPAAVRLAAQRARSNSSSQPA